MQTPFSAQPASPHIRQWVAVALTSLICVAGAATLVFGYVWLPFVVIVAAIVAYFALGNVRIMLGTIVALITILPFGTLPFKAVITPSLLSLAIGALLAMRIINALTTSDYRTNFTAFAPAVLGFIGFTLLPYFSAPKGSPTRPHSTTTLNFCSASR